MPKSFSEKERQYIIESLRKVAFESIIQKGIKKTTVDELVEKVKIPKGTFYLFYKSKELLLFDAIRKKEEELHKEMADKFTKISGDLSIESLTKLLFEFFQLGFGMGILPIMVSGELEILVRKLPDELVSESIAKDDDFLRMLTYLFPGMTEKDRKIYSAALRALFFTATYRREIGDYDDALKLLIRGIVIQMYEKSSR